MKATFIWLAAAILSVSACGQKSGRDTINHQASFPSSFDFGRLGLKVINSSINKKQGTMSTLYGNDLALRTVKAGMNQQVAGEVFALITWKQQNDPNWFGARIPGSFACVEFVRIMPPGQAGSNIVYGRMEGEKLTPNSNPALKDERVKYILSQQPSVMP